MFKGDYCDYGDRIAFEIQLHNSGFLKIYQNPVCDYKKLVRIDGASDLHSENTALFTAFLHKDTGRIYFKFGCVFLMQNLYEKNDKELLKIAHYFAQKYAKKHFDKESLNVLCKGYLRAFKRFKNFKGVA